MKQSLYTTEEQILDMLGDYYKSFIDTLPFNSSLLEEMKEEINKKTSAEVNTFFEWIDKIKPKSNQEVWFSFFDIYSEDFAVTLYSKNNEGEKINLDKANDAYCIDISSDIVKYILLFFRDRGIYCYTWTPNLNREYGMR